MTIADMHDKSVLAFVSRYPVWVTGAFVLFISLSRLAVNGGDPSAFILAGERYVVPSELHHDLKLYPWGYDGLYFYRYAMAPFSADRPYGRKVGDVGVRVDIPSYRRGRAVYPLAAWILALGQPGAIPWTLILVNILAMTGLIHLTRKMADHFGWPAWTAFLPLTIGGLWMSLARDLADLPACTLLAWAWWEILRGRRGMFLLAATLLLLCREASAFHLVPAFAVLGWQDLRHRRWVPLLGLALPWAVLAAWSAFLHHLYPVGQPALADRLAAHFTWPFAGMVEGMRQNVYLTKILALAWVLAVVGTGLWTMWSRRRHLPFTWMTVALPVNALLVTLYGLPIYIDLWSFLRVLAPVILMTFFFWMESGSPIPRWLVAWSAAMGAAILWLVVWQV